MSAALSPIRHLPRRSAPLAIACGTNELPELQRQSRDYTQARNAAGLPTTLHALPSLDHYSILEELASLDGQLTKIVRGLS